MSRKCHFLLNIISLGFVGLMMASCSSSRKSDSAYIYFNQGMDTVSAQQKEITIQPNDLLSIQVFSKTLNQEQAAIFNMPAAPPPAQGNQQANNVALQGYQVSIDGMIDMPVIGGIKAVGLTKNQLQSLLVEKLTDYVKNPSVIVRFLQFNVNVMGEVRQPGTQKFYVDRVTVIDALSSAGDLTDYGKRSDIIVIRDEGNRKVYYTVDLRKKDIFSSPAYLLKPNDIVYVGPTKNKLRNLHIDPLAQQRRSIIFSVISAALSVASIIVIANRY